MNHFLIFSSSPGGIIDLLSLASDRPITKRTFGLLCRPSLDDLGHTPSLLVLVPSPHSGENGFNKRLPRQL